MDIKIFKIISLLMSSIKLWLEINLRIENNGVLSIGSIRLYLPF